MIWGTHIKPSDFRKPPVKATLIRWRSFRLGGSPKWQTQQKTSDSGWCIQLISAKIVEAVIAIVWEWVQLEFSCTNWADLDASHWISTVISRLEKWMVHFTPLLFGPSLYCTNCYLLHFGWSGIFGVVLKYECSKFHDSSCPLWTCHKLAISPICRQTTPTMCMSPLVI